MFSFVLGHLPIRQLPSRTSYM